MFRPLNFVFLFLSLLSPIVAHAEQVVGKITDSSNQPLVNVKVCLMDTNPDTLGGLIPPGSVLNVACKTTGTDGLYSFSVARGKNYVLQIDEAYLDFAGLNLVPEYHTGERIIEKSIRQVTPLQFAAGDLTTVDFQLELGFRIRGAIKDQNNQVVAGIHVCLQAPTQGGASRCFVSDAAGKYTTPALPRGDYLLFTVSQGKYVDEFHTGNPAALAPTVADNVLKLEREANNTDFQLHPGYVVSGTVNDSKSQPVAVSNVCIRWVKPDNTRPYIGCVRVTGGTYQTPPLPPGNFLLFIPDSETHFGTWHNGKPASAPVDGIPSLVLGGGDLKSVNFTLLKGIRLSGQVQEASGLVVAGASVCYFRFDAPLEQPRNVNNCLVSDASGNYRSELLPEGQFVMGASTTTNPGVGHDGTALTWGLPITTLAPFSAAQDTVVNFKLSGSVNKFQNINAYELSGYWNTLDTNLKSIPLNELLASPSQKTLSTLGVALADIPLMADAMVTHLNKGTMTDQIPMMFTVTAASALNLSATALGKGATLSTDDFIKSMNAITKVFETVTIYDEEKNLIYGDKSTMLKQVLEGSLRSSTQLFPYLKTEVQVTALIRSMEQMLNASLHQAFQIEQDYKKLVEAFIEAAGSAGKPYALASTGGIPASNEQIKSSLRTNPLLLMRYLTKFTLNLDYPITSRNKTADKNLLASGVAIPTINTALEFHESISDIFELIWITYPMPYPLWQLEESLQSVMPGAKTDELFGKLLIIMPKDGFMSTVPSNIRIVSSLVPEGFFIQPDGSALVISEGLAITYIPAANNFVLALKEFSNYGPVKFHPNGGVTFSHAGQTISATFNFSREPTNANIIASAQLIAPANVSALDPNSVFVLDFQQKAVLQRLAPFVAPQAFHDSLLARGISYKVARETGVITINNGQLRLRPAFQVTVPTTDERNFHQKNADSFGVAFQGGDFNSDGQIDYRLITATTTQVIYGLP